ncbi:LPS O-antigen length regulator [Hafnia alvei]|uniref:LPS O-antigen length regulator Wzz(fepE) n=1 Tax=Hafnia alvei TaxID=569 RepID=UPI000B64BAC9|nr:LPS O-antigen length regulator Wzz(fepE) [Hafnia alvei]MBI0275637.1 LPS O-antigen length regulator [Hafnia alvei]PNK98375.1 LPS O-antigen length regulator [Hafnia alvei]
MTIIHHENNDAVLDSSNRKFQPPFPRDDEIDLIEWLLIAIKSYKTILIITFCFGLIGYGVAKILPQKWTSDAVVVAPQSEELTSLDELKPQLAILGIDFNVSEKDLLSLFVRDYDSQILRREYLVTTDYYKRLIEKVATNDELTKRQILDSLATKSFASFSSELSKTPADTAYSYYKLSFTADSSEDAQKTLEGYISVVNASVEKFIAGKIQRLIDISLSSEESKYDMALARLKNVQDVNINRLGYALSIADAAGVKRPLYSNGTAIKDDPDFSIALGSDGLKRKLEIEKSITDLAQLNSGLQDSKMIISKLRELKLADINFTAYKYMMKPNEPVKKDSPKTALIVLLALILGGITSVGLVTVRHVIKNRK